MLSYLNGTPRKKETGYLNTVSLITLLYNQIILEIFDKFLNFTRSHLFNICQDLFPQQKIQ